MAAAAAFGSYDFLPPFSLVFDLAALPEIPQSWIQLRLLYSSMELRLLFIFPTVFDLAALPELGIRPLKLYAAFANPAAVPWLLHIILNQF